MTTLNTVTDFLNQKRIAVVGVSHRREDFSRTLFHELQHRGYEVVPVNPEFTEMEGQRCFAHVQDIAPPVDGALLMTSPRVTDQVVQDCAAAGVKRVWMYRATGKGAVSSDALKFCESQGISVVPGECPLMFLHGGAWVHRAHGFVRKIVGHWPK
jgi:predicted CoA-binding protein